VKLHVSKWSPASLKRELWPLLRIPAWVSACNGHVLRAPADGTGSAQDLQPVDFVLISVVFLGLLVGTYVLLWRVCSAVSS
jgi:hypothetical protein